jgi:hypothetical protein
MEMCNCDTYPTTHQWGLSIRDPDGTWHFCENTIRAYGPTVSPHMFPYAVATRLPTQPLGYDPTNPTKGDAMTTDPNPRPENDPKPDPTPDSPTPDNGDENDDENDRTRVKTTTTVDAPE